MRLKIVTICSRSPIMLATIIQVRQASVYFSLVLFQPDKDGYDCHGIARKNKYHKILLSVTFRVLPWLGDKFDVRLKYCPAYVIISKKEHWSPAAA
jgi:hypothetical protein